MNWRDFFQKFRTHRIVLINADDEKAVDVETLYKIFKARMIEETCRHLVENGACVKCGATGAIKPNLPAINVKTTQDRLGFKLGDI